MGQCQQELQGKKNNEITKRTVRCISHSHVLEHTMLLFSKLHILQFDDIVELYILRQMHVYYIKLAPNPIADLFKRNDNLHQYRTRHRLDPRVELFRTSIARKRFVYMGISCGPKYIKIIVILMTLKYLKKNIRGICWGNIVTFNYIFVS